MREIKFRAWHEDDKVMICDLNSPSLIHGKLIGEDYILMQYTGLKDRNGKEIYEGDILKNEFNQLIKIEWYEEEARFCFIYLDDDFMLPPRHWILDPFKIKDSEVIGNSFETPIEWMNEIKWISLNEEPAENNALFLYILRGKDGDIFYGRFREWLQNKRLPVKRWIGCKNEITLKETPEDITEKVTHYFGISKLLEKSK